MKYNSFLYAQRQEFDYKFILELDFLPRFPLIYRLEYCPKSEPVNLQIWVDIDIIEKRVMYDEHTLFWRTSNMFDILSQF